MTAKKLIWLDPATEMPTNEEEYVLVRLKDELLSLDESPYQICRYEVEYENDPYVYPWKCEDCYRYPTKAVMKWAHIPD